LSYVLNTFYFIFVEPTSIKLSSQP